jgi:hypothetical protein
VTVFILLYRWGNHGPERGCELATDALIMGQVSGSGLWNGCFSHNAGGQHLLLERKLGALSKLLLGIQCFLGSPSVGPARCGCYSHGTDSGARHLCRSLHCSFWRAGALCPGWTELARPNLCLGLNAEIRFGVGLCCPLMATPGHDSCHTGCSKR